MTELLRNKKILLTGVSRGVGRAAAELLLKNGAEVLGVARNPERLEAAEKELHALGLTAFSSFAVDLASEAAPALVFKKVSERWDGLDMAIFNAGVMLHHEGGIMSEPDEILQQSLDQNLMAPFRIGRAILPLLLRGKEPRLLNVGSGAGTFSGLKEPNIASYRLSEWALHGLTILQAEELAGRVHVSGFDPGWVRTDLGGPNAPGTATEAADGLLKTLLLPWGASGKFYKDGQEIPW